MTNVAARSSLRVTEGRGQLFSWGVFPPCKQAAQIDLQKMTPTFSSPVRACHCHTITGLVEAVFRRPPKDVAQ